ncbi:hypothetical protein Acr_00g0103410 [Actinidia rufa]|uniref:Uncharacterized protein n=1 Tax=Actinidia rufa TaxID=165716 RepID=A0A7J0E1Q3_9ERIC|nr:hypothetical protein Acr_00g0103410 [Actinidia rufa]
MASLEAKLQRVEFAMADNRDKVEDMDQRINRLEGEMRSSIGRCKGSSTLWPNHGRRKWMLSKTRSNNHFARDCPQRAKLAALIRDDEEEPRQEEAKVGSLRLLNAIKAKVGKAKASRKGHMYVEAKEAKRLGLQLKEEQGWIKAVNTEARPIYGVARNVRLHIGDWCGQVDFTVVPMDDYPIVLGMEFLDGMHAFPIPLAETICLMAKEAHVWYHWRGKHCRNPKPCPPCNSLRRRQVLKFLLPFLPRAQELSSRPRGGMPTWPRRPKG